MKDRTQAVVKVVCAAAVVALSMTGCSADKVSEPYKDAGRAANCEPKDWVTNRAPDGFSNVATACLVTGTDCSGRSGIRVTVMFKSDDTTRGSITTVPDENC